jgi:threonine/homoserine/homoserine lactone efflux protein
VTLEQGIAFLVFAVVAAITPGPGNVMLTAAGAIGGVVRGLPCLFGVSAGMGSMIFAVAMGLGQLVLGQGNALAILNWVGAAFLLWLAWKIATAPPAVESSAARPVGFVEAAALQWVNPKAWLVSSSAASTYLQVGAQSPVLQSAWMAALFMAAALPSGFVWLLFGAALQRLLRSARAARIVNVAMGLALAGSVVFILW